MERLYRRRVSPEQIITPEVAKACSDLSFEIRRQIGLLIDRQGRIHSVIIGNDHELTIPHLPRSRSGLRMLRGLRLVHTHLNNQPLTRDDLTDLALLRLDLMMAIGIKKDGTLGDAFLAHILPRPIDEKPYREWRPCALQALDLDCQRFIHSLESELSRTTPGLRDEAKTLQALLVSVSVGYDPRQDERLEELGELVRASDIKVVGTIVQKPATLHPKYLLGPGKLKDVIIQALQSGADMLVFDRDLSPAQVRGVSDSTELRVVDRTQVILDIFARRAHSRIGKIQVELAQLRYRLPRLAQGETAFSRLGGGIGARGPGETKLETDRRRARDRIRRLERDLEEVSRGRVQQRKMRQRRAVPVVSLIGYTNAGKSTLFNALTGSHVSVQNRLFETLDATSRRWYVPSHGEVILTDTVGFIRDLPDDLLTAFETTLHELHDADLLLHVVDAHAADPTGHIQAVEAVLERLQLEAVPRVLLFNKCDLLPPDHVARWYERYRGIGISAKRLESLVRVRDVVADMLNGHTRHSWVQEGGGGHSEIAGLGIPAVVGP